MSFESTGTGGASTESTERDDFAKVEARLDEIKAINLGDMSDDDLENVMAERRALRAQKTEMVGNAQDEANAENKVREVYDEATMENQKIDALEQQKAEAERVAAEALAEAQQAEEKARALEERKNDDVEKIVALRAEITGEGKSAQEGAREVVVEKQQEEPKNEMFEKYGEKMRASARELVNVIREMTVKRGIMYNSSLSMEERLKAQGDERALNDKRNKLWGDALSGVDFRRQKGTEDYTEYRDYQHHAMDEYRRVALQDPETVLLLAESGELGDGYRPDEGIGMVDEKLRSNPEFMHKMLGVLPTAGAESFWVHVRGEAMKDRSLYIAAIQKNHLNYQWGSDEMKKDPEVQKVALASGLDPVYLNK